MAAEPPPVRPRTLTSRLRAVVDDVGENPSLRPDGSVRRRVRVLLYALRVLLVVVKQWARDRCPQQAASLAFQTAMSLVPLVAVALALLRAAGAFEAESTLVEFLSRTIFPVSQEEISARLVGWAGRLSFRTAGVMGLVMTLSLSYVMFNSVERIYNDIWRVERRRTFGQKFVTFYAVATIVPLLLGVSLYHAARYGLTRGFPGFLAALGATWAALFFANKLLPAVKVRWQAAAAGALLSGVAFELAKLLFQLYVANVAFRKYSGVYGTLGLIPIFLLWVYYSWLVILLGAEVAHTVQNLGALERRNRAAGGQPSGALAARLCVQVVRAWREGRRPSTAALAAQVDVDDDLAERVLRRLEDGGVLLETSGDDPGWAPARPPAATTLADVLKVFRAPDRAGDRTPPPGTERDRIDDVLAEIEGRAQERASEVTLEELAS